MADILAAQDGNWHDTSTWVGGVIPTTGDDVYANSYTINIDSDASASNVWNFAGAGAAIRGSFILNEGVALYSNFKAYNYVSNAPLIIHSASSGVSRLIGDTRGAYQATALSKTGTGELQITGSVFGAYQYGGTCINISSGILNIKGDLLSATGNQGYSGYRIYAQGGTVNIDGNVFGTDTNTTDYIYLINTAKMYVYGNITSGATNLYTVRLDNSNAFLFVSGSVSNVDKGNTCIFVDDNRTSDVVLHGNIENSNTGVQAVYSRKLFLNPTAPQSSTIATYDIDASLAASPRVFSTANADPNSPSISDVRNGVVYGVGNSLTGTLIVPSATNVSNGVIFDNGTVGTAQATGEDLLNAISSSSDALATRLRNVSTVETTGGQLSSLL